MTTTTLQEVFAHCLAKPTDSGRWGVFADALAESKASEDTTAECDTIREIGKCLRTRKFSAKVAAWLLNNPETRNIFARRMVVGVKSWADLTKKLDTANGRRRDRTLSENSLIAVIVRTFADADGSSWTGGGSVTNAYKHPASQTGILAVIRTDRMIRIAIGETSAKSSIPAMVGLRSNSPARICREWADSVRPDGTQLDGVVTVTVTPAEAE